MHSHFDHALDSAVVADLTGALLVGGQSTANIGRGGHLPDDRIRVVASGDEVQVGAFSLTFIASEHCPPDRFPGEITAPVVPPAKVDATMRVLVPLAEEDGVSLHFPTVWAREDPWASESPPVVE